MFELAAATARLFIRCWSVMETVAPSRRLTEPPTRSADPARFVSAAVVLSEERAERRRTGGVVGCAVGESAVPGA